MKIEQTKPVFTPIIITIEYFANTLTLTNS